MRFDLEVRFCASTAVTPEDNQKFYFDGEEDIL